MAQVNFPSSPVQDQTYTQNGITWIFNLGGWELDCPPNPVGGQVNTVVGGTNISVDATDPVNPIVNFNGALGAPITFETVSKNLPAVNATLIYAGDDLVVIDYVGGIRKTLNYTLGNLTSIVLSGTTPAGIDLTKTLAYTGDNLTSITYS